MLEQKNIFPKSAILFIAKRHKTAKKCMFTYSQVMYSLSHKQANECSIRSTGTN